MIKRRSIVLTMPVVVIAVVMGCASTETRRNDQVRETESFSHEAEADSSKAERPCEPLRRQEGQNGDIYVGDDVVYFCGNHYEVTDDIIDGFENVATRDRYVREVFSDKSESDRIQISKCIQSISVDWLDWKKEWEAGLQWLPTRDSYIDSNRRIFYAFLMEGLVCS